MAEHEAARDLGRPDQVGVEQIVQGAECLGRLHAGDCGHEIELERLAGHGRRIEQGARGVGERSELGGDGGRHRRRDTRISCFGRRGATLDAVVPPPSTR